MATEALPTQIGRYEIIKRLGAGGMAEVFLARATGAEGVEKLVVLKRVLPSFARNPKFRTMFIDEARLAMRLNHPNIVQVYDFLKVREELVLVMEYVDGLDLGRLLHAARRAGRRPPHALVAFVVSEAAKGLEYAHNRRDEHGQPMDIVHRDVSPQNVLLSYDGAVKIADFGIARARLVTEDTGVVKGKFAYMSPEQARGGRVDRRSDVYALGIMFSELLMGRAMFPGQQGLEVLEMVRVGKRTLPRSVDPLVPESLDEIAAQATEADLTARFQSAREVTRVLTRWLHDHDDVFDAAALEHFVDAVAPRDSTSPDARAAPAHLAQLSMSASRELSRGRAASGMQEQRFRERRHVVILSAFLRADPVTADAVRVTPSGSVIEGGRVAEEKAAGASAAIDIEAARVLAEIAYKADAVFDPYLDNGRQRFRLIFGLGRVTVNDPSRATRVALDVIDAIDGLSSDLLVKLGVSVGLSRGLLATSRDSTGRLLGFAAIGDAFISADALADSAEAREILSSHDIYRAARREFAFHDVSTRTIASSSGSAQAPSSAVPGTSVGVAAAGTPASAGTPSVPHTPADATSIRGYSLRGPLPQSDRRAASVSDSTATLLGRENEIREIRETYAEAVHQRKLSWLAVYGDLGIGKTALVAAAFADVEPAPRILRTECVFGVDTPYAVLADLIREIAGIGVSTNREEGVIRLQDLVRALNLDAKDREQIFTALEPILTPELATGLSSERAQRAVEAAKLFVRALAQETPLVVIIDSLQWVDPPTLELLGQLRTWSEELPILFVLVSRPDERVERAFSSVPRIEIGELSTEDASLLIRSRFAQADVPFDLEQALLERAGGNPFFVVELVEACLERGVVAIEQGSQGSRIVKRLGALALPTTLEGAIASRLSELPATERRVLQWIAVLATGVRGEELRFFTGRDESESLEALAARGLIVPRGESWSFASPVFRHVTYESIDLEDRIAMHKRIAEYLTHLPGGASPARIARHYARGGAPERAARAYWDAALLALEANRTVDALRLLGRSIALSDSEHVERKFNCHALRDRILEDLGMRFQRLRELDAMSQISLAHKSTLLEARHLIARARYELAALNIDARGFDSARDFALRARTSAQAALRDSAGSPSQESRRPVPTTDAAESVRARVAVLEAEIAERANQTAEALEHLESAREFASRVSDKREQNGLRALSALVEGRARLKQDDPERASAAFADASALALRIGHRDVVTLAMNGLGRALGRAGDPERGIRALQYAIENERLRGARGRIPDLLADLAELYRFVGMNTTAEDFAEHALEIVHELQESSAIGPSLVTLAECRIARGNCDTDTEVLLDRARDIGEYTNEAVLLTRERVARARVSHARGEHALASVIANDAVELAAGAHDTSLRVVALTERASLLVELANMPAAEAALNEALDAWLASPIEISPELPHELARGFDRVHRTAEAQTIRVRAAERAHLVASRIGDEAIRSCYLKQAVQ